jgi:PAS domain S-box-containing protein
MRERLDEALRKSEQMYRTLVETSHDIIFVVDLKGNFLFTNKAFGSILGYSDKDREKVNGFDLVHPEDLDHVSKRFAGLIEGRKENNIEYRYRIKDGSYIHILTSASPVFDSQRKVISAFGIARDITELKRSQEALRENEAKYRNVVERSNDGIVIVQDGVIKYANPSLEKMTGYKADEAIDTPFTNYIDPDEVEESVDFYRRRMAGEKLPARYERGLRHKNGTRIVAEVDGGLIRYQDKPADLVIIRDITDRKQAEEALQKTHDELEMRVQERTAELAKANEKLKVEISVRKQAEETARESEDKYKRLYDNAVVAMFRSAIEDGKALAVNDVGVHLYGYSSKEEFLSQFKGSEHYVDPDGRKEFLDALKEGPVDNFQVEFFRKDRSTFWAEFSAKMYLKEGYLEGAVIDITERKRAEKHLLEANE